MSVGRGRDSKFPPILTTGSIGQTWDRKRNCPDCVNHWAGIRLSAFAGSERGARIRGSDSAKRSGMCWPDCAKGCGRRINLRIQACPFAAGSAANAASRAQSTAPRLNRADDGEAESRSEEHTSELQSLMRISYAVFCLK